MISVFRSGRVPQPRAIDPIHLHVRVPPSGPPRPEPPIDSDSGIRIRSAPGLVLASVVGLAMAALVTVAVAAPAIDPEPDDKPAVVAAFTKSAAATASARRKLPSLMQTTLRTA